MTTEKRPALLEGGDPMADPRSFRHCLGQYATGVTIITTRVGEDRAGVTANSFASVSLDPPLVLWSISRTSRSFALFEHCENFTINVLGKSQASVSQHFSSGKEDKFASVAWSEGLKGVPVIDGAIAVFQCCVEAKYPGGDHIILVGRVKDFGRYEGEPLLFSQGRYGIADEHPDFVVSQALVSPLDPSVARRDLSMFQALFEAYRQMSAKFDQHHTEDVTGEESRTLIALYANPRISIEKLVSATYLGRRDADDAISRLLDRKFVQRDDTGNLHLTPDGVNCRLAIRERWIRFQEDELRKIPAADIEVTRRTLIRLIEQNA